MWAKCFANNTFRYARAKSYANTAFWYACGAKVLQHVTTHKNRMSSPQTHEQRGDVANTAIFLSPLVLPEKERPIAMALWASTRATRLLLPAAVCSAACRVPTLLLAQSSRLHLAPTSHTAHLALPYPVEKHAVSRRSCSMGSQGGLESESGLRGIWCRGLGYEMVRVRVEGASEMRLKHHENLPSMSVRGIRAPHEVGASLRLHRTAVLHAPRPRGEL